MLLATKSKRLEGAVWPATAVDETHGITSSMGVNHYTFAKWAGACPRRVQLLADERDMHVDAVCLSLALLDLLTPHIVTASLSKVFTDDLTLFDGSGSYEKPEAASWRGRNKHTRVCRQHRTSHGAGRQAFTPK
eukprot:CAMPEP_0172943990 /NCGR_PEP_ID=MMETSP1075-20121228/225823_1 /TAXON_ID=2916 /ORGANISM="Ceratium fusus, Strain PA161109" /LENGTH=133 /DNA_ID=CAMNT_0013805417 /DNA_START=626 /DNA_END=1027 /DNA_ORIENTATION=+